MRIRSGPIRRPVDVVAQFGNVAKLGRHDHSCNSLGEHRVCARPKHAARSHLFRYRMAALDYQDAVADRLHSLFTCVVAGSTPPSVVPDQCRWSEALEADLVRTAEKMAAAWRLRSERTVPLPVTGSGG